MIILTDYNAQLIDLLNDKIRQWKKRWNDMRKENDRLKKEIRELKKEVSTVEE